MKRLSMEWERIFVNYNKGLISKNIQGTSTTQQQKQQQQQKNNPNKKWTKDLNRFFPKNTYNGQ